MKTGLRTGPQNRSLLQRMTKRLLAGIASKTYRMRLIPLGGID